MKIYDAGGHTLRIDTVGMVEVFASITDPDGVVSKYDNPSEARADYLALTGVEA